MDFDVNQVFEDAFLKKNKSGYEKAVRVFNGLFLEFEGWGGAVKWKYKKDSHRVQHVKKIFSVG